MACDCELLDDLEDLGEIEEAVEVRDCTWATLFWVDEPNELTRWTGRVLLFVLILFKCFCCDETEFREKLEAVGLDWVRADKGGPNADAGDWGIMPWPGWPGW